MPERNLRISPARRAAVAAAAAVAAQAQTEISVPVTQRSPRHADRSRSRRSEKSPSRHSEKSPSRHSEKSSSRRSGKSPSVRSEKSPRRRSAVSPSRINNSPSQTSRKPSQSRKSPNRRKSPARQQKSPARTVPEVVIPAKEEIIEHPLVVTLKGNDFSFQSNMGHSEESSAPSVHIRRSTRVVVKKEFENMLEETKGIEQLKVSAETEVDCAEKPTSKSESHGVKEFGGVFGVLLLQFISQLAFLSSHLYTPKAQYGVKNFRIPLDWKAYFDLEIATIYLGFVVLQFVLSIIPVGKIVDGLPDKLGRLKYRCNGFLSAIITIVILGVLRHFEFRVTITDEKYVQLFVTGLLYSFAVALMLYIRGGRAHTMAQNPFAMTGSHIYDFWMGREVNPRIGPFNIKVGFYRVGMIGMIVVNAVLVLTSMEQNHGYSPTLLLAAGLQIWYALDFLWFEDGFVASFDVMYEGTGYMLALAFHMYPFMPTIITRFVLIYRVEIPLYCLGIIAVINTIGYIIYRGSNLQKSEFRRNPLNPALAHLETIPTSRGRKILVSGWWGWVQHPNYVGDIIMHWSWASTCGLIHPLPYVMVPLCTTVLLLHRAKRDYLRCKQRYGAAWDRYCNRVKYHVIPKVY